MKIFIFLSLVYSLRRETVKGRLYFKSCVLKRVTSQNKISFPWSIREKTQGIFSRQNKLLLYTVTTVEIQSLNKRQMIVQWCRRQLQCNLRPLYKICKVIEKTLPYTSRLFVIKGWTNYFFGTWPVNCDDTQ